MMTSTAKHKLHFKPPTKEFLMEKKLEKLFDTERPQLNYVLNNKITKNRLTPYEAAVGFDEISRSDSCKLFNNYLGALIEVVLKTSEYFNKTSCGGCDGENASCLFEVKLRHDTMKQSMATAEITPKLTEAIKQGKNFNVLIMNDMHNMSRNIPLHEGSGLSKIKNIEGYDEHRHRWISGDLVYALLWPDNEGRLGMYVKKLFLDFLKENKKI